MFRFFCHSPFIFIGFLFCSALEANMWTPGSGPNEVALARYFQRVDLGGNQQAKWTGQQCDGQVNLSAPQMGSAPTERPETCAPNSSLLSESQKAESVLWGMGLGYNGIDQRIYLVPVNAAGFSTTREAIDALTTAITLDDGSTATMAINIDLSHESGKEVGWEVLAQCPTNSKKCLIEPARRGSNFSFTHGWDKQQNITAIALDANYPKLVNYYRLTLSFYIGYLEGVGRNGKINSEIVRNFYELQLQKMYKYFQALFFKSVLDAEKAILFPEYRDFPIGIQNDADALGAYIGGLIHKEIRHSFKRLQKGGCLIDGGVPSIRIPQIFRGLNGIEVGYEWCDYADNGSIEYLMPARGMYGSFPLLLDRFGWFKSHASPKGSVGEGTQYPMSCYWPDGTPLSGNLPFFCSP